MANKSPSTLLIGWNFRCMYEKTWQNLWVFNRFSFKSYYLYRHCLFDTRRGCLICATWQRLEESLNVKESNNQLTGCRKLQIITCTLGAQVFATFYLPKSDSAGRPNYSLTLNITLFWQMPLSSQTTHKICKLNAGEKRNCSLITKLQNKVHLNS